MCVRIGARGRVQAGDGGEAHRRRAARGSREGAPADDRGCHAHSGGVPRVQGAQGAAKEAQERQEEEGRSGKVSRARGECQGTFEASFRQVARSTEKRQMIKPNTNLWLQFVHMLLAIT